MDDQAQKQKTDLEMGPCSQLYGKNVPYDFEKHGVSELIFNKQKEALYSISNDDIPKRGTILKFSCPKVASLVLKGNFESEDFKYVGIYVEPCDKSKYKCKSTKELSKEKFNFVQVSSRVDLKPDVDESQFVKLQTDFSIYIPLEPRVQKNFNIYFGRSEIDANSKYDLIKGQTEGSETYFVE